MPTDDRSAAQNAKFLFNRRTTLAGAHMKSGDNYSRFLSQYGEIADEPAMWQVWNFETEA